MNKEKITVGVIAGPEEKREKDILLLNENEVFVAFWGYAASGSEKENFKRFEDCEIIKIIEEDEDRITIII